MEHPENSEEYKGLTVNKGIEQPSIAVSYTHLKGIDRYGGSQQEFCSRGYLCPAFRQLSFEALG